LDTLYRRKLKKIYNKLENIASLGSDNILEFYKYIEEIIEKGDYGVFSEVINLYYDIDLSRFNDVKSFRDIVWGRICIKTSPKLSTRIQNLYKKNGLYQQSNSIYRESDSVSNSNEAISPIGQINEYEIYSDDVNYLIKNKMYSNLIGERIIELEIIKNGITYKLPNTDIEWDNTLSYDNNVFKLYTNAIKILTED